MNLPVFYRTASGKAVPAGVEILAQRTMLFVFVSKNVVADNDWCAYVEALPIESTIHFIPIALDELAFNVRGSMVWSRGY